MPMAKYGQLATAEVHLRRYYRNKNGETIQEIAKKDGVQEQTIKDSIRAVELYRIRRSVETMNENVVDVVLETLPNYKKAINDGLKAVSVVEEGNNKRKEPDHNVRMKAASELRSLIQVVQPRTPHVHATQVNVGGGQGQQPRVATGSYLGMEDRLRVINEELEKTKNAVPSRPLLQGAELHRVPESDYEDGEIVEAE